MGRFFVVAGEGEVFQFVVGGGVTGFALGASEVGRAFQPTVEEVGRDSQHRGCCRQMMLQATLEVSLPARRRSR